MKGLLPRLADMRGLDNSVDQFGEQVTAPALKQELKASEYKEARSHVITKAIMRAL